MRIDKAIHQYIDLQKYYNGFISEKLMGDTIEMTFLTISLEGFARWFMMFGDQAVIIQPESLVSRIKELVSQMNNRVNT